MYLRGVEALFMVCTLDSGSSTVTLVFLGKTIHSHISSIHAGGGKVIVTNNYYWSQ